MKVPCKGLSFARRPGSGHRPHYPNVLDIDVLGEPPPALTEAELVDWKTVHRLLGQLIMET